MKKIIFANKWVQLVQEGDWFYARRPQGTRHVLVLAVTSEEEVVLVEQHRVPVGGRTIELPAGMFKEGEGLLNAAARELEEETGYRGRDLVVVGAFVTSPGITDERAHVVVVKDAVRVSEGGGLIHEGERTTTHVVRLSNLKLFLEGFSEAGGHVSSSIYAALAVGGHWFKVERK